MAFRLRRPLALASVVTATLAGAVVLRSVFGGNGDAPPPAATATATTGTAAASSPTAPAAAGATLTATTSPLEQRAFAAGEQVTVRHGLGFLSAADGSLETWSFPGGDSTFYSLIASPDGSLLVFNANQQGSPYIIVERATGRAMQFTGGMQPLRGAAHGPLILVAAASGGRAGIQVANLTTGSLRDTGVTGEPASEGLTSPDGRRAALLAGDSLYLFELTTGAVTKLATGINTNRASIEALPGALGFALDRSSEPTRQWFTWEGVEKPGGIGRGAVSPNGKYIAVAWSPGRIESFGEGGYAAVSAVTVVDRQPNAPAAQFLGAGLVGRALSASGQAWSGASEALVIEVESGYRLVTPAGQVAAAFDDPAHVLEPKPSPAIAGLLGTSRGTIINTARSQTIAPKYAELPWHAEWTTRPGELAVQLATPGKGRSWPEQVLPFEARPGSAASATPKLAARAGGACTPLRERPELSAPVAVCLAAGTIASFAPVDPGPDQGPLPIAGRRDTTGAWLRLKADGAEGWALASGFNWAK